MENTIGIMTSSFTNSLKRQKASTIAFGLLLLGCILYTLAFLSNNWFIVHPTSHYGLWSVTFCDVLTCQEIPAYSNDEPDWYHVVQILNMVGIGSAFLLVLLFMIHLIQLPIWLSQYTAGAIPLLCIVSAISISTGLFIFYTSLIEDSPVNHPHISWASAFAGTTCLLQLLSAVLISHKK